MQKFLKRRITNMTGKLIDQQISNFISLLASDSPAPGGGSAAALSASMGTALTRMVCALTAGKKKYAEFENVVREISAEAESINAQLLENIDRDTQAYNAIYAVFSMPKETDDEKAARKEAMQTALKQAAIVPFEVMQLCLTALNLTKRAVGRSNPNAASDLGVAALTLCAGLKGAWLNVLINIGGIKDEAFVTTYKQQGDLIVKEADEVANAIVNEIIAGL